MRQGPSLPLFPLLIMTHVAAIFLHEGDGKLGKYARAMRRIILQLAAIGNVMCAVSRQFKLAHENAFKSNGSRSDLPPSLPLFDPIKVTAKCFFHSIAGRGGRRLQATIFRAARQSVRMIG